MRRTGERLGSRKEDCGLGASASAGVGERQIIDAQRDAAARVFRGLASRNQPVLAWLGAGKLEREPPRLLRIDCLQLLADESEDNEAGIPRAGFRSGARRRGRVAHRARGQGKSQRANGSKTADWEEVRWVVDLFRSSQAAGWPERKGRGEELATRGTRMPGTAIAGVTSWKTPEFNSVWAVRDT